MKEGMKKSSHNDDDDDDDDAKDERGANDGGVGADDADDNTLTAKQQKEAKREEAKRAREAERERKEAERAEAERLAKEEAEKKAQEEYDKWKDMFSVDEGGEEMAGVEEDDGKLAKFIMYLKEHKVTALEDLASEFGLKAQDAIARVQALESMGHISGVVDDRGKFIFIEPEELASVAKFIKRKGRVRISALAQESNKLIDLSPRTIAVEEEPTEEPTGEGA